MSELERGLNQRRQELARQAKDAEDQELARLDAERQRAEQYQASINQQMDAIGKQIKMRSEWQAMWNVAKNPIVGQYLAGLANLSAWSKIRTVTRYKRGIFSTKRYVESEVVTASPKISIVPEYAHVYAGVVTPFENEPIGRIVITIDYIPEEEKESSGSRTTTITFYWREKPTKSTVETHTVAGAWTGTRQEQFVVGQDRDAGFAIEVREQYPDKIHEFRGSNAIDAFIVFIQDRIINHQPLISQSYTPRYD